MRIIVVCVTYFFAFSAANIAASANVRHDGELYSKQDAGQHQYQYRDQTGNISTSSTEKMNEDGSKSIIDKRETIEKRRNKTYITRTIEETIINPQNSSIIKVIYSRVVEKIDANNPHKSTYETYQTESYPNSKTSNLCGNISPSSTIFESKPLIPLEGLKSHLPKNQVDFMNDHQIPTAATSHGYEATSEQAGVISGANFPQSASEAESSQLNLGERMNRANLPRYSPGQEHRQSYPTQYNQISKPEALSGNRLAPQDPSLEAPFRTGPAPQEPYRMYETDPLNHQSGHYEYQQNRDQYSRFPTHVPFNRNWARS